MTQILFASNNPGKIAEVRAMLASIGYEILSLSDLHDFEEIAEDGIDFRTNAWLKASYVAQKYHLPCFADDSGLEVEVLGGLPGVHSKRYSPEHTDVANNRLLLQTMQGIQHRQARFVSVICYISSHGTHYFTGTVDGVIALQPVYGNGFGYDPLFFVTEAGKMMSELTLDEKNQISHRSRAMAQFIRYLEEESHEARRLQR